MHCGFEGSQVASFWQLSASQVSAIMRNTHISPIYTLFNNVGRSTSSNGPHLERVDVGAATSRPTKKDGYTIWAGPHRNWIGPHLCVSAIGIYI